MKLAATVPIAWLISRVRSRKPSRSSPLCSSAAALRARSRSDSVEHPLVRRRPPARRWRGAPRPGSRSRARSPRRSHAACSAAPRRPARARPGAARAGPRAVAWRSSSSENPPRSSARSRSRRASRARSSSSPSSSPSASKSIATRHIVTVERGRTVPRPRSPRARAAARRSRGPGRAASWSPSAGGDDRALHQDVPLVGERLGVGGAGLGRPARAGTSGCCAGTRPVAWRMRCSRSSNSSSTLMNEQPSKSSTTNHSPKTSKIASMRSAGGGAAALRLRAQPLVGPALLALLQEGRARGRPWRGSAGTGSSWPRRTRPRSGPPRRRVCRDG